ncbi:MAG TPA: hypothetical protein VK666_06640, partial [Chryseolinea sp.]|nr:hypothetical protein [Chryseolinea sp.]
AKRTSPYKFYQYWLNTSDEDAGNFVKIFTQFGRQEIDELLVEHAAAPHERKLQQRLAKDITVRVHSVQDYDAAIKATKILFGNATTEELQTLEETMLLAAFEGVPQGTISKMSYDSCESVTELLSSATNNLIFPSKGEARKMIQAGGVSINKMKVQDSNAKPSFRLLQNKYLLAQKGKKNYYLIVVE